MKYLRNKKDLQIGELSDMFHVSASQLRFYEQEGLIKSQKSLENGYRYYGFEEMQRLEVILLLREIGTPIKDIKKIVSNFDRDTYRELIVQNIHKISNEINKLTKEKSKLQDRLKRLDQISINTFKLEKLQQQRVYLADLGKVDITSPKSIYKYTKANYFDYLDYSNIIYSFFKKDSHEVEALGGYVKENTSRFEGFPYMDIEEGTYLNYNRACVSEQELFVGLDEFRQYIANSDYKTIGLEFYCTDMDALVVKEAGFYVAYFVQVRI